LRQGGGAALPLASARVLLQYDAMFERPSRAALLGLLLLTGFLCYANALLNGFVFDDHAFVLGNPFLYSFHYWREIISGPILTAVGVHAERRSNPRVRNRTGNR
jgi:hypothetical protein